MLTEKRSTDDLNTFAEGVDEVSFHILKIISLYSGLNIKALPTSCEKVSLLSHTLS